MSAARDYHDRTTHTPSSVRASTHTLDWDIKPSPFKVYTDLAPIPLPRDLDPVAEDTLVALASPRVASQRPLALDGLATVLYYAAGVTKKKTYPGGGEVLFRAAASTGALYQTEVYVAAGEVDGLEAGLYHFCPGDFALRRLRAGDVREALGRAAADDGVARRAATVVLSAIFWRNTWKYQARGYRHLYWDSGTMAANLLAAANAMGLGPRLLAGFVDAEVNHLLGLDATREAALALIVLGADGAPGPPVATLPAIDHPIIPLSSEEVDEPLLRAIHTASSLHTAAEVRAWRARTPPAPRRPRGPIEPLPPPREEAGRGVGETIQHRGSTRRFSHAPITAVELSTALGAATRPVDGDVPRGLVDLYLIANAVEGVAPGAFCYWPEPHGLERVREGDLRRLSGYLCLEQAIGADAACVLYVLSPLDEVVRALGDRGYRGVNLQAGLAGGHAYLAAYAQRFGASGLTFYDTEVVDAFSPHASGDDAIFVVALGHSAPPPR